jgi:hypothetical protein
MAAIKGKFLGECIIYSFEPFFGKEEGTCKIPGFSLHNLERTDLRHICKLCDILHALKPQLAKETLDVGKGFILFDCCLIS